jgi:hypothetical protein
MAFEEKTRTLPAEAGLATNSSEGGVPLTGLAPDYPTRLTRARNLSPCPRVRTG